MLDRSVCNLMSFYIGVIEVCYLPAPVGLCAMCCPRDDAVDIQYKLFTRSNPNTFQIIYQDQESLAATNFDRNRQTVLYLFGFSEAVTGASTTTIRNAYLTSQDVNFIAVDWSRLIVFPWYISAVSNTRYMGERLAQFVQFLEAMGTNASTLHVIGFSLGAEAAGFGGKALRKKGIMLGRITGLDPAYPGYGLSSSDGHLAKGDALFVDVLHTNPGVFGFPQPIGDVDFYPNAGEWIQPGCWFHQLLNNKNVEFIYGCSHNRAWRLYAESVINPSGFPATLCQNWKRSGAPCRFRTDGYMGYGAQPPSAGKMYLDTNEKYPFSKTGS